MNKLNSNEIRKMFLDYFQSKGHTVCESASLLPKGDDTILFTVAGMVPFKPFFGKGKKELDYTRATSSQKCLRAGGKNSDLENVGKTARHHTFFEMLGNFSFGDYFKKEAIEYAWELLTEVYNIPADKLYASVYEDDDEAYNIWKDEIKLPENRIVKLGKEHNYWGPAGDTGACGPCSEIYFDFGEEYSCGSKDCAVGCDCERYMELYNIVFPQFDMQKSGELKPLKYPGIDTGMGLERLVRVIQSVPNNFETDLFMPIIEGIEKIAGVKYKENEKTRTTLNVIADHVRAVVFAISDGIYPTNEGRGYVIRRLLRRAIYKGKIIGIKKPFLVELAEIVISQMKEAYPDLENRKAHIINSIKNEEKKFLSTLQNGIIRFSEILILLQNRNKKLISGLDAFKLYDTYGFPIDLTDEMAEEKGYKVDKEGFINYLSLQKQKAKAAAKFVKEDILSEFKKIEWKNMNKDVATKFVGYTKLRTDCRILKYKLDKKKIVFVLDNSPFYAESGGQVSDIGFVNSDQFKIKVNKVLKQGKQNFHFGNVIEGEIKNRICTAEVSIPKRKAVAKNHTATHLLHSALKKILGNFVQQAGSLVEAERLRFDYTHSRAMTREEIQMVEQKVNEIINFGLNVQTMTKPIEEARKMGAVALFGEKYGNKVRLVNINRFSLEFCGGTHVQNTSEINSFKILSESSISSGVRRIEAITGIESYKYFSEVNSKLEDIKDVMQANDKTLLKKISAMQEENNVLRKSTEKYQQHFSNSIAAELGKKRRKLDDIYVINQEVNADNADMLKTIADSLRQKLDKTVGVLYSEIKGKLSVLVMVSNDLTKTLNAGKIVNEVAKLAGGRGGGKPHMAMAGVKDINGKKSIKAKARDVIKSFLDGDNAK